MVQRDSTRGKASAFHVTLAPCRVTESHQRPLLSTEPGISTEHGPKEKKKEKGKKKM